MDHEVTSIVRFAQNYQVEISDTKNGFFHRIRQGVGRSAEVGHWASWMNPAKLDTFRHCTEFFAGEFPIGILFCVNEIRPLIDSRASQRDRGILRDTSKAGHLPLKPASLAPLPFNID